MWKEFKAFAIKGNMIDLAVAVIIGAAFGAIVKSLVDDIIMPPIGVLLGNVDFGSLFVVLKEGTVAGPYPSPAEAAKVGAVVLRYGQFINTIINFIIIAFSIFIVVKQLARLQKKEEAPAPAPAATPEDIVLLREIRDLLKK